MQLLLMIMTATSFAAEGELPRYTAVTSDCELTSHEMSLKCKKGSCRVEESFAFYKPDCRGRLYFEYEEESIDPLIETDRGWVLASPCPGANDRYCVEDVGASARVLRRWDMPALGADAGFDVVHDGSVSFSIHGADAYDTNEGFSVRATKPVKKAPTAAVLPEASDALAASSSFGGPLERGLRDGIWLMVHTDGHPLVREMVYEDGVRVELAPWQARTSTDSAGRVTRVPELSECPRDARTDTQLGKLLTQSCTWTTEEGTYSVVASFNMEPWSLASLERILNGRLSGLSEYFAEDGTLISRGIYAAGEPVGLLETWREDGTRESAVVYAPGKLELKAERFDEYGRPVSRARSNVPGMGPRRYSATFEDGLMVSEEVPVDARTSVTRTRGERGWSVRTQTHDYTRPAEGCVADIDCPRPGRKQRGQQAACIEGACTFIPGQSVELKNLGHNVRGSGLALQDDLRQYVGDGRYAWVLPELVGSESSECVELAITPSPWLPNSAALTARGEVVEWESPDEGVVREWKEVAIVDGTWRAMYRSALVRDGQLVERASRDISLVTAAFSSLRSDRAVLSLEVYPLEAICAPTRVFARCTEGGGYGACTSTSTVLRRVTTDPPPVLSAEEPSQVRNCIVECPQSTCEAEVARWDLRLERERYQTGLKGNFALWWDRDACQASMQ